MHRPVAVGTHGMVAAGHPLAAMAGISILQRGGNAIDAAIATNAAVNVTQPNLCGIGGDIFCLIYEAKTKTVHALNGSGRSGFAADRETLIRAGHRRMPPLGPFTVNVPGCVDGWEMIRSRFGTMGYAELLAPAIDLAENGFPISHHLVDSIELGMETYRNYPSWMANFPVNGRLPRPGDRYRQPGLARSLQIIADGGRDAYYHGPIARAIAQAVQANGGWLTERDFAEHKGNWYAPTRTNYRGRTIYETAPNSQGMIAQEILNTISGDDVTALGPQSADAIHLMVEAQKLAFADRDHYISDPDFVDMPVEKLLSTEYARERRKLIVPDHAAQQRIHGDAHHATLGDTTYFAAADGEGNLISVIESLYMGFGSGLVVDGIALQNRGAYFSLNPEAANRLEPHKRTMHTLMASLAFAGDKPVLVFGTMGGDGQPQTHVQVMTNLYDFGMNIQDAIEAPRWLSGPTPNGYSLMLESRFGPQVIENLRSRGHQISVAPPWDRAFGHAQGIVVDADAGTYQGGADPRGDGYAIGY